MLVGNVKLEATFSTVRAPSFIVGIKRYGNALEYVPHYK
jgi:hypothetical protein